MRIKWRIEGFRELRLDDKVERFVHGMGEDVAAAAGNGFQSLPTANPRNRARAAVVPVTAAAAIRNAREQTLLRAVGQVQR